MKVPGDRVGSGLSETAAKELGLKAGTPVGVSVIDAYSGALGLLACRADSPLDQRLGINNDFIQRCLTLTLNYSIL